MAGQFVRGEQQKTDLLDWLKCLAVTFSTKDYGSWSHCKTSALIDMATVWTSSAKWVPKYRNKDISKNFKNFLPSLFLLSGRAVIEFLSWVAMLQSFSSCVLPSSYYKKRMNIGQPNPVALQPYRALADRAAAAGQRS